MMKASRRERATRALVFVGVLAVGACGQSPVTDASADAGVIADSGSAPGEVGEDDSGPPSEDAWVDTGAGGPEVPVLPDLFPGPCTSVRVDAAGAVIWTSEWTYDAQDRATKQVWFGPDKSVTRVLRLFYSGNQVVKQELDVGDDGSVDSVGTYQFDALGNLLEIRTDSGGDGVWDEIETFSYACWSEWIPKP